MPLFFSLSQRSTTSLAIVLIFFGVRKSRNNLRYYKDTNTFYCFSSSGEVGGSIIDYLMETEGLTVGEAIDKFSNEIMSA